MTDKMSDREALLGFAARLDSLYIEVEAWAKNNKGNYSIFSGHEAMVAMALVRSASKYLMKTAAKLS